MSDSRFGFSAQSIFTFAALIGLFFVQGCGVKGAPMPPLPDVPQQTEVAPAAEARPNPTAQSPLSSQKTKRKPPAKSSGSGQ